MKTQSDNEMSCKAGAREDTTGATKRPANPLADSRAQPWKKFVAIPTETNVVTFGKDESIRMIESRVDGKNLGG
ncbi:uncharacterized protein N7473_010570 [Penicillium subrubescens]|uniref:Uncharacterized protein n=1 Tax=Penicillium subrubescens TaxID=1316194 RepID=A0A1Q5SZG8_9EURO|nr:uncharacterized protein N7473_010570 [Penicillium subrubescens]KAJ5883684.1 hypothetical protein N7473_010570 [Penicillium subrubescens]OKO93439.1 hypothetical protein PENSUB_12502 [Penicillium subrubescens]